VVFFSQIILTRMAFQTSPSLWASVKAAIIDQNRVVEIAERFGVEVRTDKRPFFCPVCGKVKAWMRADGSGGCNTCNKTFPNVVDFIAMSTNRNADEVRREIAAYLGLASKGGSVAKALPPASPPKPSKPKPTVSKSRLSNLIPIPKRVGATFCHDTGYSPRALEMLSAKYGTWKQLQFTASQAVIACPVYGSDLSIVDHSIRHPSRGSILQFEDGTYTKIPKRVAGNGKGIILSDRHRQWIIDGVPIPGLRIVKTEGESDLLSLIERLPDDSPYIAFTNSSGARCTNTAWVIDMIERLEPCEWIICHDCDSAGRVGASKWIDAIAERSNATLKNIQLPFEYREFKGKDLQDYFLDGNQWKDFEMLIERTTACTGKDSQ
jgi:hypothetical protein